MMSDLTQLKIDAEGLSVLYIEDNHAFEISSKSFCEFLYSDLKKS